MEIKKKRGGNRRKKIKIFRTTIRFRPELWDDFKKMSRNKNISVANYLDKLMTAELKKNTKELTEKEVIK